MKNLKLYEAFGKDYYIKALADIKTMVTSNKKPSEIVNYIDSLSNNDKEDLDKIRVIIERVNRELSNYKRAFTVSSKTETTRKRSAGSDYSGSWKAGDLVTRNFYNNKYYIMFDPDRNRTRISEQFVKNQKDKYLQIIDKIEDKRILKHLCDRFFDVVEFAVNTNAAKQKICKEIFGNESETRKIAAIDALNDMDFENEVVEMTSLLKRIKAHIAKLINQ